MSESIIRINSITQLHNLLNYGKPSHPLISIMDGTKVQLNPDMYQHRFAANFYSIALKSGKCGVMYGRKHYDFEEGVLVFSAPNQVFTPTENAVQRVDQGWMLFFHPDLVRSTSLGKHIDSYTFFSYEQHEALHLSDREKATLTGLIGKIQEECEQRIDNHSQRVIVSGLELLLNYCARFYERQFHTRTTQHKEIVARVNQLLKEYYSSGYLAEQGQPTVQHLAEQVHLSANYLSDLLKKETGRTAKEHINDFIVDKAKNLLLASESSISEIAYTLGFNYPHYFSRLFKSKTGLSPQDYRSAN